MRMGGRGKAVEIGRNLLFSGLKKYLILTLAEIARLADEKSPAAVAPSVHRLVKQGGGTRNSIR